jgi:hypothetical protein
MVSRIFVLIRGVSLELLQFVNMMHNSVQGQLLGSKGLSDIRLEIWLS